MSRGQEVVYVTERAVFRLTPKGMVLDRGRARRRRPPRRAGADGSSRRSCLREPAVMATTLLHRLKVWRNQKWRTVRIARDRRRPDRQHAIWACSLGDPAYDARRHRRSRPPAAALARERSAIPYLRRTTSEMLDEVKPDGAIVATPNQLHVIVGARLHRAQGADPGREADRRLRRGGARARRRPRDKAGVPVLTGHHRRHNPIMSKAAETHRDGAHRAGHRGRRPVAQPQARRLLRRHLAQGAGRRPGADQRHPRDRLPAHAVRRHRDRPGRDRRAARATSRSRTPPPPCCSSRAARSAR